VFVARERAPATPLLDLRLFRNRVVRGGLLLTRHLRTPLVIGGGLVVAAAGFLLLTQVDGGLPLTITGMVVQSVGIGPMGGLCAIGGLNASSAICAGVVLLAAALVVRVRT
jgi:hypothetical protein